jgi:subtilisin family serine protease
MDSGINKHLDLGGNIKEGYNAINPSELPVDDYGHGTLVCGVIAAQNNDIGIVGIAPDVELYPIKVLDKYGEGNISVIANAVDWCVKNKIQIINMSFAIEEDKLLLRDAIMEAIDSGIIVVASGSNTYGGEVGYPASYERVISVTAIDKRFKIGKTSPRGKIDFSAPGVSIVSTSNDGDYEEFTGTSLAAPHITGLIALVLQNPKKFGLSNSKTNIQNEVYSLFKDFSKDLGNKGKDNVFGEGFVLLKTKETKIERGSIPNENEF